MTGHELVPIFLQHTTAYMQGVQVYILAVNTYCSSCDRFLAEVTYSIKEMESEKIHHKIPESLLSFAEEP